MKIKFKNSFKTPLFINSETGRFVEFKNNTNKLNIVNYSFDLDLCKDAYLYSLSANQIDQYVSILNEHMKKKNVPSKFLYKLEDIKNLKDKIVYIKLLSELHKGDICYHLVDLPEIFKKATKDFFKNLECFVNVKFEASEKVTENHSLFLCSVKNEFLIENSKNEALTTFLSYLKQNNFKDGAHIMYDSSVQTAFKSGLKIRNIEFVKKEAIKSVLHEILHGLGLGHPVYESVSENKQHRSLVEDTTETLLWNECKSFNAVDAIKCYQPFTKLQPADLQTLIEIWGESKDDSAYCKNTRLDFATEFADKVYLELELPLPTHDEL